MVAYFLLGGFRQAFLQSYFPQHVATVNTLEAAIQLIAEVGPTTVQSGKPMMTIEQCREFYARELRFTANLTTTGLVEAFARVPREKFLGPAPWQLGSANQRAMSAAGLGQLNYVTVTDPRDLYHNVVVSIDRAKDINNGQPGSLAL